MWLPCFSVSSSLSSFCFLGRFWISETFLNKPITRKYYPFFPKQGQEHRQARGLSQTLKIAHKYLPHKSLKKLQIFHIFASKLYSDHFSMISVFYMGQGYYIMSSSFSINDQKHLTSKSPTQVRKELPDKLFRGPESGPWLGCKPMTPSS